MTPPLPSVLVVDDEVRSQETLRRTLEEEFEVFTASSAEEALAILEREWIQIVLSDQRVSGGSGVRLLAEVRKRWPEAIRIILSDPSDSQDVIAGIQQAGIYQYLLKPWQPEQLLLTLRRAAELAHLQAEKQGLAAALRNTASVLARDGAERHPQALDRALRAPDSPMNTCCALVEKLARHDIPVLLAGESGTGKELLARALHYDSPRANQAFVVENCGALPDQLLESELFGHKRGAFTGAFEDRIGLFKQADGGSIFLDEIGDTSPAFQVKLLRVLQEGEIRPVGVARSLRVNVRVIAASNRDLEIEVREGRFREDLYYRLAALTIQIPPLRERRMDIPRIVTSLIAEAETSLGRRFAPPSQALLEHLTTWHWPGNVRELRNEVLRMMALAEDDQLEAAHLSPRILAGCARREAPPTQPPAMQTASTPHPGDLKTRLDALEASILRECLLRHRWNKSRAARELGLSRVGLRAKLSRHGLDSADPADLLGDDST